MLAKYNCVDTLCRAGFAHSDAIDLRRIAMTLHRWHEMECGDSNQYCSYSLVRGIKNGKEFTYDDNGKPFLEMHRHSENFTRYESIADRERGALKRLGKIMERYPQWAYYVQGDPRGASLYMVPRTGLFHSDPSPEYLAANYSRGIAVHK